MRKVKSVCIFFCVLLMVGCGEKGKSQEDFSTEKIITPNDWKIKIQNTDYWGAYAAAVSRDHWGRNIVANEQYIFYLTKTEIVRVERNTKKEKTLFQYQKGDEIFLSIDEDCLYYVKNQDVVYSMDFDGEQKKKILSYKMLEKEGYEYPFICGIETYRGDLYVFTSIHGDIIRYILETGQTEFVGTQADAGDFFKDAIYCVDETKRCIYKIDLQTNEKEVVRDDAGAEEDGFIYTSILCAGDALYYIRRDTQQLYRFSEEGSDEIVGGDWKYCDLVKSIDDDRIYYVCYREETYNADTPYYFGFYGQDDAGSTPVLLPEDFFAPVVVIGNTFYYSVSYEGKKHTTYPNYYKACVW